MSRVGAQSMQAFQGLHLLGGWGWVALRLRAEASRLGCLSRLGPRLSGMLASCITTTLEGWATVEHDSSLSP